MLQCDDYPSHSIVFEWRIAWSSALEMLNSGTFGSDLSGVYSLKSITDCNTKCRCKSEYIVLSNDMALDSHNLSFFQKKTKLWPITSKPTSYHQLHVSFFTIHFVECKFFNNYFLSAVSKLFVRIALLLSQGIGSVIRDEIALKILSILRGKNRQ